MYAYLNHLKLCCPIYDFLFNSGTEKGYWEAHLMLQNPAHMSL